MRFCGHACSPTSGYFRSWMNGQTKNKNNVIKKSFFSVQSFGNKIKVFHLTHASLISSACHLAFLYRKVGKSKNMKLESIFFVNFYVASYFLKLYISKMKELFWKLLVDVNLIK